MSTSHVEGTTRLAQNTITAHAVAMGRLALCPIDWIAVKHTIAVMVKSKGKSKANPAGEVSNAAFI